MSPSGDGLPAFDANRGRHGRRGVSHAEKEQKLRLMNNHRRVHEIRRRQGRFVSLMASEGYAVRWEMGRKYITYTTEGMRCRDNKLHEEKLQGGHGA